jgi:hypothetical protein
MMKTKARKPKPAGTDKPKRRSKCDDQLSKTLANGKREPPGDRGACERESASQGSE